MELMKKISVGIQEDFSDLEIVIWQSSFTLKSMFHMLKCPECHVNASKRKFIHGLEKSEIGSYLT